MEDYVLCLISLMIQTMEEKQYYEPKKIAQQAKVISQSRMSSAEQQCVQSHQQHCAHYHYGQWILKKNNIYLLFIFLWFLLNNHLRNVAERDDSKGYL